MYGEEQVSIYLDNIVKKRQASALFKDMDFVTQERVKRRWERLQREMLSPQIVPSIAVMHSAGTSLEIEVQVFQEVQQQQLFQQQVEVEARQIVKDVLEIQVRPHKHLPLGNIFEKTYAWLTFEDCQRTESCSLETTEFV